MESLQWEETANDMLTFLCFTNPHRPAILSVVEFDFHGAKATFVKGNNRKW